MGLPDAGETGEPGDVCCQVRHSPDGRARGGPPMAASLPNSHYRPSDGDRAMFPAPFHPVASARATSELAIQSETFGHKV